MKLKIKVKVLTDSCTPVIIDKGDWIDLYSAENVTLKAPYAKTLHKNKQSDNTVEKTREVVFDSTLINLGVAMKLPKGYEALILPRSSTFKKWGLFQSDHMAVMDESYCGDNDIWWLPVTATRSVTIPKGTRLCQFRIQLSQKATMWQKIKWLFSSGIKIEVVDELGNSDRGGFGTTGKN